MEREGSSCLGFLAGFEVGDDCDYMMYIIFLYCFIVILVYVCMLQCWSLWKCEVWLSLPWNHEITYDYWWCNCNCNCVVWLGIRLPCSGKLIWVRLPRYIIKLDRISVSNIKWDQISTYQHANRFDFRFCERTNYVKAGELCCCSVCW